MKEGESQRICARRGFCGSQPSFSPIQDARFYFDYHHSAADTLDKIVPRELQENAAVMSVLGYALTNIPVDLPRSAPRPPRE